MKFNSGDVIYAHELEQMRRFRAGVWKGGSGIAANHSGSRTRLVLRDKTGGGAAIWEPYGSKGGGYTNELRYGADITVLMRQINALEYNTVPNFISGLAADADHVFITCATDDKVLKYTLDGDFVLSFGESGTGDGQFDWAADVAINGSKVFVVDKNNRRVQEFTKDGVYVSQFNIQATGGSDERGSSIWANATDVYIGYGSNVAGENIIEQYEHDGTFVAAHSGSAPLNCVGIAGNASNIYAYTGSAIYRLALDLSSPTFIATVDSTTSSHKGLSLSATHMYFQHNDSDDVDKRTLTGVAVAEFGASQITGLDFANNQVYTAEACQLAVYDADGASVDSWAYIYGGTGPTFWYAYPTESLGDAVSLGTPDGGVSVPALDGIDGTVVAKNYILEMRTAIEALAPFYINAATGNRFNWTDLSADNLYNVVFGGSDYDWERTTGDMTTDDTTYDVDINEIYQCIVELEASATRCG